MESLDIAEKIKKSFCNLIAIKNRKKTIEVITGYSTINSKFISVFIYKLAGGKYIITDSGWFDQNYYDTPYYDESEDILIKIKNTYTHTYDIKYTTDKDGNVYYYKSTFNIEHIPTLVYDLANFLLGVVNSYCIQFKDEKEEKERETFRKEADSFLKINYEGRVKMRKPLDDFKNIKFNAIIYKGMELNLISYITGSTITYFENDLKKSIVNFEISERSISKKDIKTKISIINDESEGYNVVKSQNLINLLSEKLSRKPILWSEKEKILEIIN